MFCPLVSSPLFYFDLYRPILQLSGPSVTINNGSRDNIGRAGEAGSYTDRCVYVGAVGARFEREGRMEYQDMLVTPEQNTKENGYGYQDPSLMKVFSKFYNQEYFPQFSEGKHKESAYKQVDENRFLHKEAYTRRIQISAETFLLEAEHRGLTEKRDIYCHVVGLGLGVWQITAAQNKYFLRAWARAISQIKFERVKDVNFSWIAKNPQVVELQHGKQLNGVNVHFSRRNPFDVLPEQDQDKLIVAMFAWDGNSYVGNEYWQGHLSASGDPAAAACSTIPELLNPDINSVNISGSNCKVATRAQGLVSIQDFLEKKNSNITETT